MGFAGEPFFNLVIGFDTRQSPQVLAKNLRRIEANEGRRRRAERFSARTLDLDLLLFEDHVILQDRIQILRHEILVFAFVLKSLADILPEGIFFYTGYSYRRHWRMFQTRHPDQAANLKPLPNPHLET